MNFIATRKEASHFSSSLEFLVRLSLGQWGEIDWAIRLSSFGGAEIDKRLEVSDRLQSRLNHWHVNDLKMPQNGYFGIFSENVSDEVREIMTLYKMLRIGVVSGAELTQPLERWEEVGMESELIAYKASSKGSAVLRVGGPVSDLSEDTVWLTLSDGDLVKKTVADVLEADRAALVNLTIPAVDPDWFWGILSLAHRAWSSLKDETVFNKERFTPIEEWVARDSSEVSRRAREADMQALFTDVGRLFDSLRQGSKAKISE